MVSSYSVGIVSLFNINCIIQCGSIQVKGSDPSGVNGNLKMDVLVIQVIGLDPDTL